MDEMKKWIAEVFSRTAPEYGQKGSSFFSYFGENLVEVSNVQGKLGLDVATGKGAVLLPLSKKIDKVIGIDISQQMLDNMIAPNNAELIQMDAEHLNFEDNVFDCVFCGFGLFFFPDINRALQEFKRVLKPGGILAISTWGKDTEIDQIQNEEIDKIARYKPLISSPLFTEDKIKSVLQDNHFTSIQIIEDNYAFHYSDFEEFWNSLWMHAIRAKLEQLDANQLKTYKERIHARIGNHPKETMQAFYGIAKKPSLQN